MSAAYGIPAHWLTGNPIQFEQIYWKVKPIAWNNFAQSNLTTHCWNDTSNSKYLKRKSKSLCKDKVNHIWKPKKKLLQHILFKEKLCTWLVYVCIYQAV